MKLFSKKKLIAVLLASVLSACGGESRVSDETDSVSQDGSSELVTLKAGLHQSLVDHCGSCHGDTGNFSPFATSDSDSAFELIEKKELINLSNPANSQIVNYMRSEHNCGGNCDVWAAAFTESIENIAVKSDDNIDSGSNPDDAAPEPVILSESELAFSTTLYPILRENCSACHGEVDGTSGIEVAKFAHVDVRLAHSVIRNRSRALLDLERFESSQIVTRLAVDQHMCGDLNSCSVNADLVVGAIKDWLQTETETETQNPPVPTVDAKNRDISIRAFEESVWRVTREYCSFCHDGTLTDIPKHAAANVEIAHDAVINNHLANAEDPPASILVQRLERDHHYCWPDSRACEKSAMMMFTMIGQWKLLVEKYNEEAEQ